MPTSSKGSPKQTQVRVPLHAPEIGTREQELVEECLRTGWISSAGSFVPRFERSVADFVGVPHAVATVSGTAALHLALIAADVRDGDEVVTSTLSFIAPANAIRYVGAHPVFVDCEPKHWQIDVQLVSEFLAKCCERREEGTFNKDTGRRVSAILPVDVLGHPVAMDELLDIAAEWGLVVVEDATESLGALYNGVPVGSRSSIACFSFNGNKLITTGGGGMLVTAYEDWADHARHLSTQAKAEPTAYVHDEIGFNYRLTNLQAAVGIGQMERIDDFIAKKQLISECYDQAVAELEGVSTMVEAIWARSTHWLYTMLIDADVAPVNRDRLMHALRSAGIECRPLWQPLHLSRPHRGAQRVGGKIAERIAETSVSLPSSVGLGGDQELVLSVLFDVWART